MPGKTTMANIRLRSVSSRKPLCCHVSVFNRLFNFHPVSYRLLQVLRVSPVLTLMISPPGFFGGDSADFKHGAPRNLSFRKDIVDLRKLFEGAGDPKQLACLARLKMMAHLCELAGLGKSVFAAKSTALEIEEIKTESPFPDTPRPVEETDPLEEDLLS